MPLYCGVAAGITRAAAARTDLNAAAKLHWSIEFIWLKLCNCLVAPNSADVFIVNFVTISEALGIRPPYWIISL
ncbi:hypothetical protein HJFPF1_09478 [Paramyrothecium foliicola]|nr:hypothetical protein HJFPF1_09478 [Paramyrothecium foliicola]